MLEQLPPGLGKENIYDWLEDHELWRQRCAVTPVVLDGLVNILAVDGVLVVREREALQHRHFVILPRTLLKLLQA
jgi:hypothetical protein